MRDSQSDIAGNEPTMLSGGAADPGETLSGGAPHLKSFGPLRNERTGRRLIPPAVPVFSRGFR
jgi:hypothetical protein